ncbi:MAG: BREX-6 system BrxE protein [Candidatus Xenobium sp.]|jgi:hypothetical protein|nr:BREX-6 system BrxE protein [Burkholderiales bacterium]
MSTHLVSTATTDQILALQFLVGWAGEGHCEPSRLGWWRTDVVDEMGGGDFFRRLLPRTYPWASLEAARRAAMLADRKARSMMADPDGVRTLFFWGFELDEQLTGRIRDLKMGGKELEDGEVQPLAPTATLPFPEGLYPGGYFDRQRLEEALRALAPDAAYQALPTGRQVKAPLPGDPARAARMLAGCLVPLGTEYIPPFFRL